MRFLIKYALKTYYFIKRRILFWIEYALRVRYLKPTHYWSKLRYKLRACYFTLRTYHYRLRTIRHHIRIFIRIPLVSLRIFKIWIAALREDGPVAFKALVENGILFPLIMYLFLIK